MHALKEYLQDKSLKKFAAEIGTNPVYLCHIISGKRKPGPEMIRKIVAATNGAVTPERLRPDWAEIFKS